MSDPCVVLCPTSSSPENGQVARARAWAYVFECYSRRKGQQGGPATSRLDDAERRSSEIGATEKHTG
jgi:hypothetical protein